MAKKALNKDFNQVAMPKKGKQNSQQLEEAADRTFIGLCKKHSAVESNINELEHSGLNKVPDKGIYGFKRYVALGVLAYNIKRLGRLVMEKNKAEAINKTKRIRQAA